MPPTPRQVTGIVAPQNTGRIGPYVASDGSVWVFGASGAGDIVARGSTDRVSFDLSVTRTVTSTFYSISTQQVGNVVHLAVATAKPSVEYTSFDLLTRTFSTQSVIFSGANGSVGAKNFVSLVVRESGERVVVFSGLYRAMGTNYDKISLARSTNGTTWTTSVNDGTSTVVYDSALAALGTGGRVHILYGKSGNASLFHRSFTSANAWGAETTAGTGPGTSVTHPFADALSWVSSGTTRDVLFAYRNASSQLAVLRATSTSDSPTWSALTVSDVPIYSTPTYNAGALALESETVRHALYARQSDRALWRDTFRGSAWGVDQAVLLGADANILSAGYEDKKLLLTYESAGEVYYAEEVLVNPVAIEASASGAASSSAAATLITGVFEQVGYQARKDDGGERELAGEQVVTATAATNAELMRGDGGADRNRLAQSFTLSAGGRLTNLTWRLYRSGTPTDAVIFELMSSLNGSPIATSTPIQGADLPTSLTARIVEFPTSPILVPGTYFVVMRRTGVRDTTNEYGTGFHNANPYPGGTAWYQSNVNPQIWTERADRDFLLDLTLEPVPAATWSAPADTPWTQPADEPFRLRTRVAQSSVSGGQSAFGLEYAPQLQNPPLLVNPPTQYNAGGPVDVDYGQAFTTGGEAGTLDFIETHLWARYPPLAGNLFLDLRADSISGPVLGTASVAAADVKYWDPGQNGLRFSFYSQGIVLAANTTYYWRLRRDVSDRAEVSVIWGTAPSGAYTGTLRRDNFSFAYTIAQQARTPWAPVGTSGAATPARYHDSPHLTHGEPTSQLLGSGPFTPGVVAESAPTPSLLFSGAGETEIEWSLALDPDQVLPGDQLQFRVVRASGTPLQSYASFPTLTVGSGSVVQVPLQARVSGTAQSTALPRLVHVKRLLALAAGTALAQATPLPRARLHAHPGSVGELTAVRAHLKSASGFVPARLQRKYPGGGWEPLG